MSKHMHALLPRLISGLGHILPYNISVQKALELISWSYVAYVPKKTELSPLPSGWTAVLANDLSEESKNIFQKIGIFFANVLPFRKILKRIENQDSAVVFIELFELQHLASLGLALFFLNPKFHFWMVYRYELEKNSFKAIFLGVFLKFMYRKLGKENVKCLTDSQLLAESLGKIFKAPFFVIPIPHTEKKIQKRKKKEKGKLFWWPGGLIRKEKGLLNIQRLASLLQDRADIQLIMAEKAKEIFGKQPRIRFVSTFLARKEYIGWMQRSDLILLPYLSDHYSQRTSGIFVEAISLGAIPVTSQGTWMAYELSRFDLSELILKWDEKDLVDRLVYLSENRSVKKKLEFMFSYYQDFHSLKGFAANMQKIGI